MARVRMVTRTVATTVVEIMGLNVVTCEVSIIKYELPSCPEGKELEVAKKLYETDEFKLVKVESTEVKEVLYGMPESEFIKLAKVLPPRTSTEE